MGYHAPKAEDVYRYIFRLDNRDRAGLSDGFSWSILFLNDNSPVCKEFLAQYGVELCYRTAARIRFVFFSGLETEDFQRLAGAGWGGGILTRVLQATISRRPSQRRYDFERDNWDVFRPPAFHPLSSQEHISRKISLECQTHSAMPGSGEALRLAQNLGIGRFVPCFLLFSDIGTLTVSLLPIAHRSPMQVFERLRTWIDSFYEVNHTVLTRWASIEGAIEEAVRKYKISVDKVDYWRNKRKEQWTALQTVSKYLNQVANNPPSTTLLQQLNSDYSIPWQIRDLIKPFSEKLQAIYQKQQDAQKVRTWLNKIRSINDPELLHPELSNFKNQHAAKLPESARACLTVALNLLSPVKLPSSPESELADWWRSEFGRPTSRKRYDKYRTAWAHYSQMKHGESAVGNVASILRNEFEVVQQTVLTQLVSASPENSAQAVIERLATHLDVVQQDADWEKCVSDYQQHLRDYFANLRSNAPTWLIALGARLSPPLQWKDCIPIAEQRKKVGYRKALDELPRLRELVQGSMLDWTARLREIEEEHQERQKASIDELTSVIETWFSSISPLEADKQSIWPAMVASLLQARQDLEDQIFKNASEAIRASYPGDVFSRNETAELLHLFDEYERAVKAIRLPFEEDGEVLRVTLDASLIEASRIWADTPITSVAERVKSELRSAVHGAERTVHEWEALRKEASVWSPAGELVSALTKILGSNRMMEVQSSLRVETPEAAISMLTSRQQIISVLDLLSVHELTALENHVLREKPPDGRATAVTKQELYDSILVAIGLLPQHGETGSFDLEPIAADKLKNLRDKVKRGVFDVFMAHNTQDKDAVLRLSRELRHQGINPWVDVEQIPPGRWFQDVIQSAVRTVKTAAVIIGGTGLGRWQALELRVFMSRCIEQGIPLIPVLLPGVTMIPEGLEFLRELNYVRFKEDVTEEEGLSRLVWGITGEKL